MAKKNHGWVLFYNPDKDYVDERNCSGVELNKAKIFETRKQARIIKIEDDRVRKVCVEDGVAVEIIPGR